MGENTINKVSIVIRTYNEEKFLPELLEAIEAQECPFQFEVVIVDSGSTDKTLDIVSRSETNLVHIKKSDFSFGRSLNYGCKAATGEILVFISAHCIPTDNHWLKNLVSPFEDPKVALCYGRQVGNEISKFSENQVFAKYFPEDETKQQGGFFCNNANSAIRKGLWELRQFDEELTGLEDMDWAKHQYKNGFKIQYVASANIYHIHEESWKKIMIRYERESYALKEIMPEIHFNLIDMIWAIKRGILTDFQAAVKKKVLLSKLHQIFLFRVCQFYGSYKGNHIHRKLSKKKKQTYFYP